LAKFNTSDCDLKKRSVAASLSGRLSYAASSQLAISFLSHRALHQTDCRREGGKRANEPNCAYEAVHEELVLLRRGLLPRVPYFAVASLHEPPLEVDGVPDERVRDQFVGGERERLERRVEICDAVLDEKADEVEAADGEFALGVREDGAVTSSTCENIGGKGRGGKARL
jgi:hypothetical protein